MAAMTNPSDDQPDPNKPSDASTPPPPTPSEPDQSDVTQVATPPGSTPPAPTQPMYGQTYGEQPSNPYGGATFDQKPPVPPAPAAGYGTPPPPSYGGQPGYGQAPYGAQPAYSGAVGAPDSGATTAMVLGIIGLAGGFFCGLPIVLSPFALFVGLAAKKRIDASAGALTGRGNAQAGFILGIIGTVLLVLSILAIVVVIIIGVSGGFDSGYDSGYDSYDSEF